MECVIHDTSAPVSILNIKFVEQTGRLTDQESVDWEGLVLDDSSATTPMTGDGDASNSIPTALAPCVIAGVERQTAAKWPFLPHELHLRPNAGHAGRLLLCEPAWPHHGLAVVPLFLCMDGVGAGSDGMPLRWRRLLASCYFSPNRDAALTRGLAACAATSPEIFSACLALRTASVRVSFAGSICCSYLAT